MRSRVLLLIAWISSSGLVLAQQGADSLHRDALVWDCHNDLAYRVLYEGLDIGRRLPAGHVDIPRLREGHVDVQTVALFVENFLYPDKCARQAFQLIEAMKRAIEKNSLAVGLARTGSDVERIVREGRIAMPLAVEGGHAIENDLELLRKFHGLGVSSMTLTHNISHDWADSSADKPRWNGLNDLGRQVVREMNRLGMVIDISHVSDPTFFQVLEISSDPVIARLFNIPILFASPSSTRTIQSSNSSPFPFWLKSRLRLSGVHTICLIEYGGCVVQSSLLSFPWRVMIVRRSTSCPAFHFLKAILVRSLERAKRSPRTFFCAA